LFIIIELAKNLNPQKTFVSMSVDQNNSDAIVFLIPMCVLTHHRYHVTPSITPFMEVSVPWCVWSKHMPIVFGINGKPSAEQFHTGRGLT
jgi:hypothetical protein